jgi:FAD/FMN-containing dehydrogenase
MQLTMRPPGVALTDFADTVGVSGPVAVEGGRTQWDVGGPGDPATRLLRAPSGILELEPAELVVRCGAGTTVAELDAALAEHNLMSPVDPPQPDRATVGGVLSVGRSGIRRLRYGHVRDLLLEARYVAGDGQLVKAGAPVVKNVTGYDLCRLLVGALGTVGLIGEVVLRCRPLPAVREWFSSTDVDPFALRRSLFGASSILWDGCTTWVLLEGDLAEVHAGLASLPGPWIPSAAPDIPLHRAALRPRELRSLPDAGERGWLAEIGVGTVHGLSRPATPLPAPVVALCQDIKRAYDPSLRLNPGRQPW